MVSGMSAPSCPTLSKYIFERSKTVCSVSCVRERGRDDSWSVDVWLVSWTHQSYQCNLVRTHSDIRHTTSSRRGGPVSICSIVKNV